MTLPPSATAALAVLSLLAAPGAALADEVTLHASDRQVVYGRATTLDGSVSPAAGGEPVTIVDSRGATVASVTTGADGSFSVRLQPRKGATLTAGWHAVTSAPVALTVRPALRVRFGEAALLAPTTLSIRVAPASGVRIHAVVAAGRRRLLERQAWVHGGVLRLTVPADARRLRVYVTTRADGLASSFATTARGFAPVALGPGSRGPGVCGLKQRLSELAFHQAALSPVWTLDTGDAVLAFQKAEGLPRSGIADASTLLRLATATPIQPRFRSKGTHIEVDKTRQILMIVRDGVVTGILNVSTGATGNTPVGRWHVLWKAPATGTWLGSAILYRTMTFHGGFAIHGFSPVPAYRASHGCVREPMWAADWTYKQTPVGEEIDVY
jgi:lipoprotein-anchoring transpeptidase ErfK/SrfK